MKVITIKQPFATLIAEGLKEYEFRTWKTKYRGEILIHAGKGVDKKAMKRYEDLNLDYPSGCIIAKAVITDCVYVDEKLKDILKEKNEKVYHGVIKKESTWQGYGFKLENIQKIVPISAKGKLSLWDYEYEGK
ncbi:MAG: ASCH domain-containing protein [Bacilli bacterium]|nr:ASCH domain-containing protein [Bacilli bacterium]